MKNFNPGARSHASGVSNGSLMHILSRIEDGYIFVRKFISIVNIWIVLLCAVTISQFLQAEEGGKLAPVPKLPKKSILFGGTPDSVSPVLPQPSYDKRGLHKTAIKEFSKLRDTERGGRRVPIKIIYPLDGGGYPLIVFSHGGMGNWDANIYQAEHLASHGYVVFCLQHIFSDNVITKKYIKEAQGTLKQRVQKAIMRMTTDPRSVLERPRDVSFAIDKAMEWNRKGASLDGKINTSRIAVAGHSYGAGTVLAACGAQPILNYLNPPVKPGKGLAGDLSDPRITAGIAMSPQGLGTSRFGKASYGTVKRPLLCFSGDKDDQLGADASIQPAEKRMEVFKLMPPEDKYMLWLANADHMCFSDSPRAWLLPSKARPDAQRITKAMMVVFCNYYLKDNKKAKKYLNSDYANTLTGNVVTKLTWHQK